MPGLNFQTVNKQIDPDVPGLKRWSGDTSLFRKEYSGTWTVANPTARLLTDDFITFKVANPRSVHISVSGYIVNRRWTSGTGFNAVYTAYPAQRVQMCPIIWDYNEERRHYLGMKRVYDKPMLDFNMIQGDPDNETRTPFQWSMSHVFNNGIYGFSWHPIAVPEWTFNMQISTQVTAYPVTGQSTLGELLEETPVNFFRPVVTSDGGT